MMKFDPLYRELPDSFDERVPELPVPPKKSRAWDLTIGSFGVLLLFGSVLLGIVPKFGLVYDQVRVPLGSVTKALLGLSLALRAYPWIGIVALVIIPWALGLLRGRHASVARALIPVASVAVLGWLIIALFLPLIGELEGVGRRS